MNIKLKKDLKSLAKKHNLVLFFSCVYCGAYEDADYDGPKCDVHDEFVTFRKITKKTK